MKIINARLRGQTELFSLSVAQGLITHITPQTAALSANLPECIANSLRIVLALSNGSEPSAGNKSTTIRSGMRLSVVTSNPT